ncbi:MAG: hypothetical protein Q7V09_10215 [Hydrogenophaga sp.]|uniref:lipopolysaccharide biosynthesis protein n=1 Tax=Hydrogenophaga sp. TaxID=1904254 RepID=UPI002724566D|nr:hypothetical protein [Hydrogenophaga sp.]MDO9030795.1 hypothetical protein [Hydrogenophaga sp.]
MNVGRVIRTVGAHGFGQAITLVSTLLIPAIAIRSIGPDSFGILLTITGISQLLLFADLGISHSLANHICMLPQARSSEARATIIKTRKLALKYSLISTLVFFLLSAGYFVFNANTGIEKTDIIVCYILFSISASLQFTINLFGAVQRYQDKPDAAVYFTNICRLVEVTALVTAYLLSTNLVVIALCALSARILTSAIANKRVNAFINALPHTDNDQSIKDIALAGKGIALTRTIQHLTLHAPVILISAVISPTTATLFSTTRTLSRLAMQPISIGIASIQHEWTMYWARNEQKTFHRLTTITLLVSVLTLLATTGITLLFLPQISNAWLSEKLTLSSALFIPAAIAAIAQAATLPLTQSLSSINKTKTLANILMIVTTISFTVAYMVLAQTKSAVAMSFCLAAGEVLLIPLLVNEFRSLLQKHRP